MKRPVRILLVVMLAVTAGAAFAAQPPFGVGLPDSGGGGLLPWVAGLQKSFYRDLTAALKDLKDSGQAFWWLAGLSFAYGIVHAAGPGHGKVVISSYLLANEESAKRGAVIAFAAAMTQAAVAVALVGLAAIALNMTSIAITDTARLFEIGSYALITGLGLYLLARKVRQLMGVRPSANVDARAADAAPSCGHHHVPLPQDVKEVRGISGAAAAVLSVGIRPCSGALIVLVFALAQGLFWAGVASTFLMGIGTAMTIGVLATMAVGAKGLAGRLAGGDGRRAGLIVLALEVLGALAITGFGLLLLGGALYA
ncbi:MAG TPA: nickel/cobalt transporter [Afifellaceae bacterium]|nr:nickel/cobalt transporter [Afifellaceae bacterium]